MAKKIRKISIDDLDLSLIDKNKFKKLSRKYKFLPLQNLIQKLKL